MTKNEGIYDARGMNVSDFKMSDELLSELLNALTEGIWYDFKSQILVKGDSIYFAACSVDTTVEDSTPVEDEYVEIEEDEDIIEGEFTESDDTEDTADGED